MNGSVDLASYATLLAATIAIEAAVVTAIVLATPSSRRPPDFPRLRRTLLDVLLLNLFTHPLATLAIVGLALSHAAVELAVMLAEACGYRLLTGHRCAVALLLAAAANGVTWALSFVVS